MPATMGDAVGEADAWRAGGETMPTPTAVLETVNTSESACTMLMASIARPLGMTP